MSTNKPRITVTLEQDDYDLLSEFAKQQRCSMSSALVDIWKEVAPTILRVVKLLREAEATKETIGDRVKDLAADSQSQIMPMARQAIAQFDIFESEVMRAISEAKASARGAEGGLAGGRGPTSTPPSVPSSKGAKGRRKSQ